MIETIERTVVLDSKRIRDQVGLMSGVQAEFLAKHFMMEDKDD